MKKTKNQFVTSIEQLIKLIKKDNYNYAVVLGGGGIYSRKDIDYNEKTKKFKIINHIDETKQNLTKKQLMNPDYTLIGKAMSLNSLIAIIE